MTRYRSLLVNQWPEPDRQAWTDACRPDERLTPGGVASDLIATTQKTLARGYGYLLDFCCRADRFDKSAALLAHVQPAIIEAFLSERSEEHTSELQSLRHL